MFYICNVEQWIDEVIENCNQKNLNPADSLFMLMFFSSLDFSFVEFFRDRKLQISQFSGSNFHILTPMIYNDIVPDHEWRELRAEFNKTGIPIGPEPFALFFYLVKNEAQKGYLTHVFAGFKCPDFGEFMGIIRNIIDAGIINRKNQKRLEYEFVQLFKSPNMIKNVAHPLSILSETVQQKVAIPRYFISYSHKDKDFVSFLSEEFYRRGKRIWIDKEDLKLGDEITLVIKQALNSCDGLLAILSSNSINSNWLQFEGSFFSANDKKPIIPLTLDEEAKHNIHKLPFLRDRLYLDFSSESLYNESLNKLLGIIGE